MKVNHKIVVDDIVSGMYASEMAAKHGCSKQNIHAIAKKHGLDIARKPRNQKCKTLSEARKDKKWLINTDKSLSELAREEGLAVNVVTYWFNKYNLSYGRPESSIDESLFDGKKTYKDIADICGTSVSNVYMYHMRNPNLNVYKQKKHTKERLGTKMQIIRDGDWTDMTCCEISHALNSTVNYTSYLLRIFNKKYLRNHPKR